jgi:hypothetical protein
MDDDQAVAPLRPPTREQSPKQSIPKAKARATSSAALEHGDLMAQRYRFHSSAARVRGSLPGAFENDALVAVPIAAGYREPFKPPTNLRGSSCEEPQGEYRRH